jgi:hypothetical protein
MSEIASTLSQQVEALRLAFDGAFVEAFRDEAVVTDDLLTFTLGNKAHALRLSEVGGVFSGLKITPMPSTALGFRGLVSLRGQILPVYDLHVMLGHPPSVAPRWLFTAKAAHVAFAFETFAGHVRAPRAAIAPRAGGQGAVGEFVSVNGIAHPLVTLDAVIKTIKGR